MKTKAVTESISSCPGFRYGIAADPQSGFGHAVVESDRVEEAEGWLKQRYFLVGEPAATTDQLVFLQVQLRPHSSQPNHPNG